MIDIKSILGYQKGSPYINNPYLDIHTPEGLIDMSNTPIDLLGIDNKGNKKKMKANSKNPYKFDGNMVREIPMQTGGLTPLQQANIDAKRMAKSWGLINAEDVYVDKIPQYIDGATGKPYSAPPTKMLPTSLPSYVSVNDIQSDGTRYWYTDPKTTDLVDVDPRVVRSKKPFKLGGDFRNGGLKAIDFYKYIFDDEQSQAPKINNVQEETPIEPSSSLSSYEDKVDESQKEFESLMGILSSTDDYDKDVDYSINIGTSSNKGFATFSSPEEGRQALERQLELYKSGRTKVGLSGNSTLLQAMNKYAPVGDGNNNPYSYAQTVAKYTGVDVNTPISKIDTKKWADVITKVEGNKSGNNPGNLRR